MFETMVGVGRLNDKISPRLLADSVMNHLKSLRERDPADKGAESQHTSERAPPRQVRLDSAWLPLDAFYTHFMLLFGVLR